MPRGKKDPLAELAEGLAGDHALAKNAGTVGEIVSQASVEAVDMGEIGGAPEAPSADTATTEDPPRFDDDEQGAIDAAFQNRLDRLVRIVEEAEFDSGTAVGDVRDVLVELFKTRDKPYHLLDANMRRDLDNYLTKVAQQVVRRVVLVVAEEDSLTIQATMVGKFAVNGDSLELKLKVDHADDDVILATHKMAGHQVVVISATDKRFGSARRPNDPGETQTEIPFADAAPVAEKPADPPADDSDLAGDNRLLVDGKVTTAPIINEPAGQLEAVASDPDAPDWAVYDDEGEVWLAAATEDDPWTDDADKAMRFTLQAAKDECESHGEGMVVQRHALATGEGDEG